MEKKDHLSNEELASYALHSLDAAEAQTVEAHLSGCAECRAALAQYAEVSDGLLFALPPQAPPARLRARLAEQIAASPRTSAPPQAAVSPRPAVTRPAPAPRPRLRLSFLQAVQFALLIALLAGNVFQAVQVANLQQREALLVKALSQQQAVVAFAAQPGISVLPLAAGQVTGSLLISADQKNGVVLVRGLAALDAAHTYQMWLIPPTGSPLSVGLFQAPGGGATVVAEISSATPMKSYAAFGVTVEPSAGSTAPTTTPILVGEF